MEVEIMEKLADDELKRIVRIVANRRATILRELDEMIEMLLKAKALLLELESVRPEKQQGATHE